MLGCGVAMNEKLPFPRTETEIVASVSYWENQISIACRALQYAVRQRDIYEKELEDRA